MGLHLEACWHCVVVFVSFPSLMVAGSCKVCFECAIGLTGAQVVCDMSREVRQGPSASVPLMAYL
jgi:hypothetical protein